jgi:hypothetical protein
MNGDDFDDVDDLDDFQTVREQGLPYVDRTRLIRAVLDEKAQVILLPRPREAGEELNSSMLRCYFEWREEDLSGLFVDLEIARSTEAHLDHFQRYPVIYLVFEGLEGATSEDAWASVRLTIAETFEEHEYLLRSPELSEQEALDFRAILAGIGDRALYETALLDLSRHLRLHHGAKVVVLVDDRDEGLHASGYSAEIVDFLRVFLTEGLRGNPHIFKAVLSGIPGVAEEGLFLGPSEPVAGLLS